jgi:hypothetical protein
METKSDNVRSIYPLNHTKIFSHEEALELVSLLTLISAKTKREVNLFNSQLSFLKANTPKAIELQNKINSSLQNWSEKVRRLGAIPVSFCKVRIPAEEGQFMWEYPEKRLFLH